MTIVCRGIRGATTAENTPESISAATQELLERIVELNGLVPDQIAAAYFTVTPDLNAAFPSTTARVALGWTDVALLDAIHVDVPGSQPKCIRVLLLVNTAKPASALHYVYLREAANLRAQTTIPSGS